MCRVKWGFPKAEYLGMTLKEFVALRDIESPPEQLAYADDVL